MDINEIVERAEKATERAHVAVAKLDRTVFRQAIRVDPTPKVWLVHHLTNEAFKMLVSSRTACTDAVTASIASDSIMFERKYRECERYADLAIYLASRVDVILSEPE